MFSVAVVVTIDITIGITITLTTIIIIIIISIINIIRSHWLQDYSGPALHRVLPWFQPYCVVVVVIDVDVGIQIYVTVAVISTVSIFFLPFQLVYRDVTSGCRG